MNKRNNKYRCCGLFSRVILLAFLGVLAACSNPNNPQAYLKTFDHILTDQYIWGGGGIYWVSNEQVVLEAHVKDEKGELDRGLYQVDVRDGSYTKIVEVPDKTPITYMYCFEGKTLHVMRSRGTFTQTNPANGYQIEIREKGELNERNDYSPIRCRYVDLPIEAKAKFIPLKPEDGFLKNKAGATKDVPVKTFLTDELGTNLKEIAKLPFGEGGVLGIRYVVPHMNAYFGNSYFDKDCTKLSWLYRDDWRLEQKEICLKDWTHGSRVILQLKGALYVEHHTDTKNEPKSYVIDPENEQPVETEQIRGSTVSADGCKVAYGIGKYRSGREGPRQVLRVFDYCAFRGSISS